MFNLHICTAGIEFAKYKNNKMKNIQATLLLALLALNPES